MKLSKVSLVVASALAVLSGQAAAFTFETEFVKGSFDTQLTAGFGRRLGDQDCALVGDPGTTCNPSSTPEQWTVGDDGNQNYNKGDYFSQYIKGTHELLLAFPDQWKFMARGTWLRDFKADDTRRTELHEDAKEQLTRDKRLLDLWVSKDFELGGNAGRARFGKQVISWGESIFIAGGINATNALDLQKLNVPGTQLKEAVIPGRILSVATGLGNGLNTEAYYQFDWNANRLAPVGSYFNAGDQFGKGWQNGQVAGAAVPQTNNYEHKPKKNGQYGVALHYKPKDMQADFGVYAMQYHDKMPNVLLNNTTGALELEYLEKRKLFGVSTNFGLGNWSIGAELSYRPKDAIALAPVAGACGAGAPADCHLSTDESRYQAHLTAQLQLMSGEHGAFLDAIGASTAYLTGEVVGIKYPGVNSRSRYTINGVTYGPSAGGLPWLDGSGGTALSNVTGVNGSSTSWGYVVDFNATYDNKIIPGWQVIPGVTHFQAVNGDTPNVMGTFLEGFKATNFYVLFNQNPAIWQAGVNYTRYWGGDRTRQLLGDRDFIGGFVTRNF